MKQILWTIQHEEAYSEFKKTGVLVANDKYLFCNGNFQFEYAYRWISNQMRKRVGESPQGVKFPIWAWYQWEGQRKRRDLRLSGYAERGTPLVQIAFEADDTTFLLSDFDDWHIVLSNQFVATSEAEWVNNQNMTQSDVETSWERIFDLTQHHANDWYTPMEEKSIQATLWEIHISQVKKVEHFIAK